MLYIITAAGITQAVLSENMEEKWKRFSVTCYKMADFQTALTIYHGNIVMIVTPITYTDQIQDKAVCIRVWRLSKNI